MKRLNMKRLNSKKLSIRKILALLTALAVMLAAGAALGETDIIVTGSGEVLVSADAAMISLGVSAREKNVLDAQRKVNEAVDAIRGALEAMGVEKENINTDYLSVYAVYDYSGDLEKITAYNASSTLAIRVTRLEEAGTIIDTAFAAGANTLNGITFSAENTDEARAEALKAAVADARSKAAVLAEAGGMKLKEIKTVTEGNTFSYDSGVNNFSAKMVRDTEEAAGATYGTLVQAAKLTVSTVVTITFTAE